MGPMNILVFKLCGNVRFAGKETNGGQTEIQVVVDQLLKMGHHVGVITIKRYFDEAPAGVKCFDWSPESISQAAREYDLAFIFNGSLNCYGGVISDEALSSYAFMSNFKKPMIYAVTDTTIPIGSAESWLVNAQSKQKYQNLVPSNYHVPAEKIYCLTQTYDTSILQKIWKGDENKFGMYGHFPFETTVLFRKKLELNVCDSPEVDLIYFGNPRGGRRDKKFVKFYCNLPKDISSVAYGNWNDNNIENLTKVEDIASFPTFMGKSDMYALHAKINRAGAHCYISDPANEGTIWTTRFYEAILNRTVLFVDIANDPKMERFSDPFFYVRNRDDLVERLRMMKGNPALRREKIDNQFQMIGSIVKLVPDYGKLIDYHIQKAVRFFHEQV